MEINSNESYNSKYDGCKPSLVTRIFAPFGTRPTEFCLYIKMCFKLVFCEGENIYLWSFLPNRGQIDIIAKASAKRGSRHGAVTILTFIRNYDLCTWLLILLR